MRNTHGSFIWYELLTPDPDAAAAFYGAVVGWTTHAHGAGGEYRLWRTGAGVDVGGLMAPPGEAGMPATWLGYIGVDDVDQTVARVVAAGGATHMPATDMPGVGRMAMVADPQGAPFYVMRGAVDGVSESFKPATLGHCGWNELMSTEPVAALAFYGDTFGWAKGETMPMGAMGDYQLFTHAGTPTGAIMPKPAEAPRSHWSFYFHVADIDRAAELVVAHDGTLLNGPMVVPGGDFVLQGLDPQGALFALVGPRTR
jgi:predicted enzyme related to lactoylglutathione lyase